MTRRLRGHPTGRGSLTRASRGLTLLEMLVVLVLVSLLATLAFQGLGYVLDKRDRFTRYLDGMRERALFDAWYGNVVAGLYPARSESDNRFQGSGERVSGLTMQSLTEPTGVPVPFSLRLERADGGIVLRYQERGELNWILQRWPDAARAHFRYADGSGGWRSQWPPERDLSEARPPQLPASVALHLESATGNAGDARRVWQADVEATRYVPPSIRDLL